MKNGSMENLGVTRWPYLLLGMVTLLFAGIIYASSILKAPLGTEFGWSAADLALNFTLTMCCFCLGGLISGLLNKKMSARLRMIISALMVCAGFVIVSRLNGGSPMLLYLAYGILAGLGIGIVYNVVIAVTNSWFPDKKGLCSGCLMMSFGFSTLILGNIAGKMIEMPAVGWRTTFLVLGLAIGIVLLLAGLLIKSPDAQVLEKLNKNKPATAAAAANDSGLELNGGEMIRRFSFWKVFVFFILLAAVGNAAISFAKDFSISVGANESLAVTLVGVLSICNGLGRLLSGALFDKKGLNFTRYTASVVVITASLLSLIAVLGNSFILGIAGLCLCGISYGFCPTLSASWVMAFYGTKNFALNFSIMNLILIPASFSATIAGSLITASGSYLSSFILLTACSVLGLVINFAIRRP